MIFTVNYTAKWRLKGNNNYVWTNCKKLYNLHTCRFINKSVKGSKVGYWIGTKFTELSELRKNIELIPKEILPF